MPATTEQAMNFLENAHHGPNKWYRMCLMLAREARGIASMHATAHDAQVATPQSHRIAWGDMERGHIAYFGKPGDANTADHIATCAGRTGDGRLRWWTNDAVRSGGVDMVVDPSRSASWFGSHWSEPFIHGADYLNGVAFSVGPTKSDWAHGPIYQPRLHRGVENSDSVRRLQYRLSHHNNLPGQVPITGNYAGQTVEMVSTWQRRIAKSGPNDGTELTLVQARRLFGDSYSVRAHM